jgi:AhpD family alkylhydroperoxidase
MEPRLKNAIFQIPGALDTLQALGKLPERAGLPPTIVPLVHLRASQINGCSVCVDMHWRLAKPAGESDERLFAVAAWRDAPYFTEAERAALALTEAVTRIADSSDPVPNVVWDEAARHFDDKGLAGLVLAIATINTFNRINVATRQVAGEWIKSQQAAKPSAA